MRSKNTKELSIKISYLVVARNEIRTIGVCLDSLMANRPDEVVVVDGRSTDGTSEVIDRYPVIHLYDDGKGPAAARNLALGAATGDYVVIIDGDQWIPPGFDGDLRRILRKKYDVVFCPLKWWGPSRWTRARETEIRGVTSLATMIPRRHSHLPRVYRWSFVLKVGGWRDDFLSYEDHDLWKRIHALNPEIFSSNLVIYHDASNMSLVTEFNRGREVCTSLFKYVKCYPSEWPELSNIILPFSFFVNLLIVSNVFLITRDIKMTLLVLILRVDRFAGWLVGLFFPGRPVDRFSFLRRPTNRR